jgi:hypothetical protein
MVVKRSVTRLLAGTALVGASVLTVAPGFAQDAQNQKLQNQINSLQQQLQALQDQMSQGRTPVLYNEASARATSPMVTKGPAWLPGGVQISLAGSFLAFEGAWRQHNEVSDGASDPPFANPGIPLPNSVLFNENELRFSSQQSRIALKATGDIDPTQHLKGYYEMDFLGASTDANNRESNSFTPRIRQLYGEYDNDNYHFHTAFGQTWSAVTQERVGMLPGAENTPLTIDAQYVVGFDWTRQPTVRLVEDWNKQVWFGLSIEQPQVVFPGGLGPASVVPTGFDVNASNTCTGSSHLNNTTSCSNDVAPDLVEKIAVDPGWGHYEVFALERWFADNTVTTNAAGTVATGVNSTQVTTGWGVGGNVLLPVVPKFLDLQGSVLGGQGIGRYTSSQLPDVTVGPNGQLSPIQQISFLVGAVAHPFAGNDFYAYFGEDQVNRNAFGANNGYGNPNVATGACAGPVALGASFGGISGAGLAAGNGNFNGPGASNTGCAFNVQRALEFTVGFWQDAYKGDLGRVRVGLEYEFVQLTAFTGATTATTASPTPNQGLTQNNNIVFLSLRYYPFN